MMLTQSVMKEMGDLPGDQSLFLGILRDTLC